MRNNEDRLGTNQQLHDQAPPITQQSEQLSLNFVVPTEFVDLPSKGRFYPPDHPLHGQSSIEIKQMTAKEEDILTSKSLLKKGVALEKMMQSIVVDKTIDLDTLTIEDRSAIVIAARIYGYGPEYTTSVICPACEKKAKFTFDLSKKLESDEDSSEPKYELLEDGNFVINVPVSKWRFVCRALNGRDEKLFAKITEAKKKMSNDSLLLDQLELMTVSIQGVTDRKTISDALLALPAADSKYLRRVYSQIVVPVDMKQAFVCPSCEAEADMEVPLTADFFWFK